MPSRRSTPAGQRLFRRIEATGWDLSTTRPRCMYWLEGLHEGLGEAGAGRLVDALIERARGAHNPPAWLNWSMGIAWQTLLPDRAIRKVHRGQLATPRTEGAMESLGALLRRAF